LFEALLANAATLERGYQSLIDDRNRPGLRRLTDELHECHKIWLTDRERFISELKAADVPPIALELIVTSLAEIADRIAQLKLRVPAKGR